MQNDSDPNKPWQRKAHTFRVATALGIKDGSPYFWRPLLDEIAPIVDRKQRGYKQATVTLARLVEGVQDDLARLDQSQDEPVRQELTQYYELALKEIYEFAESRQLAIAATIRKRVREGRHPHLR